MVNRIKPQGLLFRRERQPFTTRVINCLRRIWDRLSSCRFRRSVPTRTRVETIESLSLGIQERRTMPILLGARGMMEQQRRTKHVVINASASVIQLNLEQTFGDIRSPPEVQRQHDEAFPDDYLTDMADMRNRKRAMIPTGPHVEDPPVITLVTGYQGATEDAKILAAAVATKTRYHRDKYERRYALTPVE
ncbi:unnamed protein product [Caenorhabditis bovis]|uniref:Uncharacterized protein n=1 Tax=Caenorhabditis bovis TaxID=2654633 RepID=A0A8S1FBU0_9PELO|nr:unnamed protein product [Caenorhabditis bovis]